MKKYKTKTHHTLFFIILGIFVLLIILSSINFGNDEKIIWGATFSKKQCEELGLDWQEVYEKIINELPIQSIRMPIYWDDVETRPDQYDLSDCIWMANQAAAKNIEIVPVLGRRVPRWPECHVPKFYQDLSEQKLKPKIFNLIKTEIEHFQNYPNILKWQIDNEPFADFFGLCPASDEALVKSEIEFVKNLDNRPILITESGELSTWTRGAKLADILGVSMYRQTWNKKWGYFYYPFAPAFYYFKAQLVKALTGIQHIINTELQVEPWTKEDGSLTSSPRLGSGQASLKDMDLFDQFYVMDLPQVKTNINFAKRSGINEIYLWGVEWWYWLGQEHNNWEFWEYGKTLMNADIR